MASGVTRTDWAFALLDAHALDVVGLQEFQPTAVAALPRHPRPDLRRVPLQGRHGEHADLAPLDGSRRSVEQHLSIPYFGGHPKAMPVVQLRDKRNGREFWVINAHNPYGSSQTRWRHEAQAGSADLASQLPPTAPRSSSPAT